MRKRSASRYSRPFRELVQHPRHTESHHTKGLSSLRDRNVLILGMIAAGLYLLGKLFVDSFSMSNVFPCEGARGEVPKSMTG